MAMWNTPHNKIVNGNMALAGHPPGTPIRFEPILPEKSLGHSYSFPGVISSFPTKRSSIMD